MKISSTTFWILAGTVILAVILMIAAIVWMYLRKKKLVKKYRAKNLNFKKEIIKIRENAGELLWELKNKTKNPLDDFQMEFAINTIFRNGYKTFNISGFKTNYEKESLSKLSKAKLVSKDFEFILINGDKKDINHLFDKYYGQLKSNSMIMVANASRKGKSIKELMNYLKIIKAKYDWSKYGKGVVIVVK